MSKRELNSVQIGRCFKIISLMSPNKYVRLKDIRIGMPYLSTKDIRDHITLIQERMVSKFQNSTGKIFIIKDPNNSNVKGYKITNNRKELKHFLKHLRRKYKSIKYQIDELERVINNKENYE